MNVTPLHDERVVVTVSPHHPLAQRESVTLSDLANETLIFTSNRSGVRRLVLQRFRQMGVHLRNCMEINDTETRIHYVSQNIGVAFSMDRTHHWETQKASVRVPVEPKLTRTYALVTSQSGASRHPQAIKQLQNFLLKTLKNEEAE